MYRWPCRHGTCIPGFPLDSELEPHLVFQLCLGITTAAQLYCRQDDMCQQKVRSAPVAGVLCWLTHGELMMTAVNAETRPQQAVEVADGCSNELFNPNTHLLPHRLPL
jgi:hypothetical protein